MRPVRTQVEPGRVAGPLERALDVAGEVVSPQRSITSQLGTPIRNPYFVADAQPISASRIAAALARYGRAGAGGRVGRDRQRTSDLRTLLPDHRGDGSHATQHEVELVEPERSSQRSGSR